MSPRRRRAMVLVATIGGEHVLGWILGIPFWAGFILGVILTLILVALF